jgi:hypothetical protein
MQEGIREPHARELALLKRLIAAVCAARAALESQLPGLHVSALDEYGSLRLLPAAGQAAVASNCLPAEGYFDLADGVGVSVLLHLRAGHLYELEFVPDEPSACVVIPEPTAISIMSR